MPRCYTIQKGENSRKQRVGKKIILDIIYLIILGTLTLTLLYFLISTLFRTQSGYSKWVEFLVYLTLIIICFYIYRKYLKYLIIDETKRERLFGLPKIVMD